MQTVQSAPGENAPSGMLFGSGRHIPILDGWRALSILMVMAGHLLPIGPARWELNGAVAASGMALFFTLSGFLITRFLLHRPQVRDFLIRRLFRIVPLAWTAMAILAVANRSDLRTILDNLLFVSNLPPSPLFHGGEHLWSLCVEVQFYVGIALLVALLGRRGLYLLPLFCLTVTAIRISEHALISIYTWQRVDEILAGSVLALVYTKMQSRGTPIAPPKLLPILLFPLVIASGHPAFPMLNYARPYLAAGMVGLSLFAVPTAMYRLFTSRPARYIAETSYALYVIHGMLSSSWLGEGPTLTKYLKRPLLIALTFAVAHGSTFRFERPLVAIGKRLSR